MPTSTLTHGVSIGQTGKGAVLVSIEIENTVEASDNQAILASAYAQLSQAIAENKQTTTDSGNRDPIEKPNSETAAEAPGSGAWWSQ